MHQTPKTPKTTQQTKKMATWKKRGLGIFFGLVLLVGVLTFAVGTYFVNFALLPSEETKNQDISPPDKTAGEDERIIQQTREAYKTFRTEVLGRSDIQKETVSIQSEGLRLEGDLYTPQAPALSPKAHRYAIVVHGYKSSRQDPHPLNLAAEYLSRGIKVLAPDARAHGASDGKYIGMGWTDRLDLLQWVRWIVARDPDAEIILHGVSMGAAEVMMVAGEELPTNVRAIIEDSGYTSVWDEFVAELEYVFHLPPFPVLYMADVMAGVHAGYHLREASSVAQLKKAKVPMLFIHGTADTFVPYAMLKENVSAYPGTTKMELTISGAGHVQTYYRERKLYWQNVDTFLERYAGWALSLEAEE